MPERAQVSIKKPEAKRENKASQTQKTGTPQPISSPVEQILFLQKTIGNQAVGRLIKSGALQAKLRIGRPEDIYEQEADRVAEQVMRMPEPVTQRKQHKLSRINMESVFETDSIICKSTSRANPAILRKPQQSPESTEFIGKGLPERVLRYLDKPSFFSGNPSVTATIRVKGIDIEFQDGGKLYIDRSETPLDAILIKQKLEKLEASLKWYIRILGPSLASEGKISALAENELANRLFIIRRITEGKNLKDILSELNFLDIANFKFIAMSAKIIPFIAGIGVAPTVAPSAGMAGGRQVAIREAEKKVLGEAGKKIVSGAGPFQLVGRLKQIWDNPKWFLNWLRGNLSLARIKNPLSHAEAQQVIANARRHGLKLDLNATGLQGMEKKGRWAEIPHFKIEEVHIPIASGFKP